MRGVVRVESPAAAEDFERLSDGLSSEIGRFLDGTLANLRGKLERFWEPSAITIVGASDSTHAALSMWTNLTRGDIRFQGPIQLVNPRRESLFGQKCYSSVNEVPGELGVLALVVPATACFEVLDSLEEMPEAVSIYAEGFGFRDEDPLAMSGLAEWGRRKGVLVFGPGWAGTVNARAEMFAIPGPHSDQFVAGPVGLVMQSGGLTGSLMRELMRAGYGIARAVAYGKGAMVGCAELCLDELLCDDVEIVCCYAERAPSVEGLRLVGRTAQELGKPVVLVVPGTSKAGQLVAQSHTGALASERRLIEGMCEQFGIVLVGDLATMILAVDALMSSGRQKALPPRAGVFGVSGGAAILSADRLVAAGVELPAPTNATRKVLECDEARATYNPFDAGAISLDNIDRYRRLVEVYASDENFGVVVGVSGIGLATPEYGGHVQQAEAFLGAVTGAKKIPVLAGPVHQEVAEVIVWPDAVLAGGGDALGTKVRAICDWSAGRRGPPMEDAFIPGAPLPPGEVAKVIAGVEAERILRTVPVRWPRSVTFRELDAGALATLRSWFPVVVKTVSGATHRAGHGGVLLGIDNCETLERAVAFMLARFGGEVTVTEEIDHEEEIFAGVERLADAYVVMAGLGGAQLGTKTALRVLPVDRDQVDGLICKLALDDIAHGRCVDLVLGLQELVRSNPEIRSIDLNPIIVKDDEIVVLDGKVHVDDSTAMTRSSR